MQGDFSYCIILQYYFIFHLKILHCNSAKNIISYIMFKIPIKNNRQNLQKGKKTIELFNSITFKILLRRSNIYNKRSGQNIYIINRKHVCE